MRNQHAIVRTRQLIAGIFLVAMASANSSGWAAGTLASPTRDGEVLPPPPVEQIHNEWVFDGYICSMETGNDMEGKIGLSMKTEPFCQGATAGFVSICFVSIGGGLSCPHEDNPGRHSYLYDPELKPALLQILQQSMFRGQRLKVWRLSNTFNYPQYEGPQLYGNKVEFSALGLE